MKKTTRVISIFIVVLMLSSAFVLSSFAAKTPFSDVKDNYWFADAVAYCYNNKYVTGTSAKTFSPNTNLTRAQFVTLLANICGADVSVYSDVDSGFADVKKEHWFHNAVTWASNRGYVSGTSETKFSPNANVTREQLARIFYVYSEKQGYNVSTRADLSKYSDYGKISSWAKDQVSWAISRGIINGMSATTIAPRGNATRAQAAQIIMTYTQLDLKKDINRYRAFCSKLKPYIPDDANIWGVNKAFMHNETLGTNTYTKNGYTYTNTKTIEFSYFDVADVLTFRYRNELSRMQSGSSYPSVGYSEMYGAIYQGKTEIYINSYDIDTGNRYKTMGSFSGDKHNYTLVEFGGYKYTEAQAKQAAASFSTEAVTALDNVSKKLCGYRFMSVANTAPKYASLSGMTPINKLVYSLPIDFEYYNELEYQTLEYRYDHVDASTSNGSDYKNNKAVVSITYYLDDLFFSSYYAEDTSSRENGVYVERSTMLSIDLDRSPVSLILSHTDGDNKYNARIYLNANGSYTYEVTTSKNMTDAQIASNIKAFMSRAISRCDKSLKEIAGISLATLCN